MLLSGDIAAKLSEAAHNGKRWKKETPPQSARGVLAKLTSTPRQFHWAFPHRGMCRRPIYVRTQSSGWRRIRRGFDRETASPFWRFRRLNHVLNCPRFRA